MGSIECHHLEGILVGRFGIVAMGCDCFPPQDIRRNLVGIVDSYLLAFLVILDLVLLDPTCNGVSIDMFAFSMPRSFQVVCGSPISSP